MPTLSHFHTMVRSKKYNYVTTEKRHPCSGTTQNGCLCYIRIDKEVTDDNAVAADDDVLSNDNCSTMNKGVKGKKKSTPKVGKFVPYLFAASA